MNPRNKPLFTGLALFVIASQLLVACSLQTSAPPQDPNIVSTSVAQTVQAQGAASPSPAGGQVVAANGVELTVPAGLGTGASSSVVPQRDEAGLPSSPPYINFALIGYPVGEASLKLYRINDYPMDDMRARDDVSKVFAVLASPNTPLTKEAMPQFAEPVFMLQGYRLVTAVGMKILPFQNGNGVRMVSVHTNSVAAGGSGVLTYHYHGLTSDGQYAFYLSLPLSAKFLQDGLNFQTGFRGGVNEVPFPVDPAAMSYEAYTAQIEQKINAALAANTLSPAIDLMDALVQSIKINSSGVALPAFAPAPVSTIAPTPTTVTACVDSGMLESEDPQDGTKYKAGETFQKRWTLRNTGTCTWNSSYRLVFADGQQMASANEIAPLTSNSIPPGSSLPIYVNMQAPGKSGEYIGKWAWVDGARKYVPISFNGTPSSVVTVKIRVAKEEVPVLRGSVTEVNLTYGLLEGTDCGGDAVYRVSATVFVDGPVSVDLSWGYRVAASGPTGTVINGVLDTDQQHLDFPQAGSETLFFYLSPPYFDTTLRPIQALTLLVYFNGQQLERGIEICN